MTPRGRTALITLAAVALCGGAGWFIVRVATPNIVAAGQRAAEERAVSLLRELRWAQQQGGVVPLPELVQRLGSSRLAPIGAGVHRAEGYCYALFVTGPGRWTGYAWPAERGKSGTRTFVIDQDERICETREGGYEGTTNVPAVDAAALPCDGVRWKPWKSKGERRR